MTTEEKVQYYAEKYGFEIANSLVIVLAIFYFIWGKGRNDKMVLNWMKAVSPIFQQNFAHLGFEQNVNTIKLHQAAYTEYQFYATGRQNVEFVDVKIELEHRQCIFSSLLLQPLLKYQDLIKVQLPIQVAPQTLADGQVTNITPLELLIIKKKAQKSVLEKISYIKKMVGIVKAKNYDVIEGDSFIYCDSEEACNGIIDSQVGDMLTKYSAFIEQIHITD